MKRLLLFAILLLVLLAAIGAGVWYYRWTRPAPRAAELLPETTLMFLDVPDLPKARASFQTTAAYALWQEPEVQEFIQPALQGLSDALGRGLIRKQDNKAIEPILNAIQGETFLAVTHVGFIPNLQPGVIFGADVKGKRLEISMVLARLPEMIKTHQHDAKFAQKRHLGISYDVWEVYPNYPVCHTFLNSMLVFTLGEDTMREAIGRFTHKGKFTTKSLSAGAGYQTVTGHMPRDYEFLAYANVQQIYGLLGPVMMMVPQNGGMLEKLAKIQATGSGFKFADGLVHDVRFASYSSPEPKAPVTTPRKSLGLTAPDTALYWVQNTDVGGLYQGLVDTLAMSGRPDLANPAARFDKKINAIRDHLFSSLGPETAILGAWRAGMKFPELALVAAIQDPQRTRPEVDQALHALKDVTLGNDDQVPWDDNDHGGVAVHSIRIGSGRIAPTYATTDQFLIVAFTPDFAGELLDQAAAARQPAAGDAPRRGTLSANPAYEKIMAQLPANGSAYAYCDLRALFEPCYHLAQTALTQAGDGDVSLFATKLPKAETIARHLSPFASATVGDQRGVTTTAISPVGTPGVFVGALAGAACAAYSWVPEGTVPSIGALPKKTSSTGAPPPAPGNRTATSQTPARP